MCITYAADHETDGVIPGWFVAAFFQKPKELQDAIDTLTELGMWEQRADDDFVIHDFLEFHESKAKKAEKRAEEAQRKKEERERKRREEEADAEVLAA